jgi:hypothetical protein
MLEQEQPSRYYSYDLSPHYKPGDRNSDSAHYKDTARTYWVQIKKSPNAEEERYPCKELFWDNEKCLPVILYEGKYYKAKLDHNAANDYWTTDVFDPKNIVE